MTEGLTYACQTAKLHNKSIKNLTITISLLCTVEVWVWLLVS